MKGPNNQYLENYNREYRVENKNYNENVHRVEIGNNNEYRVENKSNMNNEIKIYNCSNVGTMKHMNLEIEKERDDYVNRKFLLDTGAGISIMKKHCLTDNIALGESEIIIKGITKDPMKTAGKYTLNIDLKGYKVSHEFIVIDNDENVNLEYDGIIGNDFLEKVNAQIIYEENKLIINKTIPIKLHKLTRENVNENDDKNNVHVLKARTETILEVEVSNSEIDEGVISTSNINIPGVYLSKAIVKVKDNHRVNCTILNTTEKDLEIKKLKISLEPINNKIFKLNHSNEVNMFERKRHVAVLRSYKHRKKKSLSRKNTHRHIF
jgi:hypothetical protein